MILLCQSALRCLDADLNSPGKGFHDIPFPDTCAKLSFTLTAISYNPADLLLFQLSIVSRNFFIRIRVARIHGMNFPFAEDSHPIRYRIFYPVHRPRLASFVRF